jgi:hypothetical protein
MMKNKKKQPETEYKRVVEIIEENKNRSYGNILLERRKAVMQKLGIKQDFLRSK